MRAAVVLVTVVIDMQTENPPSLVNSLKIQSKAVDLFVVLQRKPHVGLPVMHDSGNIRVSQGELNGCFA